MCHCLIFNYEGIMKIKWLFSILLVSNAFSLDLTEVYESSVLNSHALASQKSLTNAQKSQIDVAWAAMLPTPVYTLNPVKQDEVLLSPHAAALTVSGTIIDPSSWAGLKTQYEKNKLYSLQFEAYKQSFGLSVLKAYFDILKADKSLKAALEERLASEQMTRELKSKFDAGLIPRVDLVEAQAQLDQVISTAFAKKAELEIARVKMSQFTPESILSLNDLTADCQLQDLLTLIMSKRDECGASTQIKISNQQLKTADQEYRQLGYSFIPKFTYSYTYYDNFKGKEKFHQLQWHPFSATTLAQEKSLKYSYQSALHQKKQSAIEDFIVKEQQVMTINSLLSQIKAQYQINISAEEKLQTVQASFDAGTRTTAEVLHAQSLKIQARMHLYLLKYQCLELLFQYAQQVGMNDNQILNIINSKLTAPVFFTDLTN